MAEGQAAERKQELRKQMTHRRDALSAEEQERRSEAICECAVRGWSAQLQRWRDEGLVFGLFVPFRSEPDVMGIARWCWERSVPLAAPVLDRRTKMMAYHRISGDQDLQTGAYGIREPKPETPTINESRLAAMLVPGLAFDAKGGRLGYGGGYYDRFLERIHAAGHTPILIAPAFELQLVDEVPTAAHDARVHSIVTESRIIQCRPEEEERSANSAHGTQ